MSSRKRNEPAEQAPELGLLAEALDGRLPAATAVAALLRRPAAARLRDDFAASLRGRWGPPDDPAPWVAAALGLADPRHAAPRAYERGERFVARLRGSPARRRPGIVRKARQEAANPALLDLFVAESRRVQGGDPGAALAWLDLGRLAAAALGAAGFPRAPLDAAHLRLAAHRANAHRLAGDLPAAERDFAALAADPRLLALAAPAARAELLSLEASLRIDLRQFGAAESLLTRAEQLSHAVGDSAGAARALLQRGSAAEYAGEGERAVELHRRAVELLDPETEPVLYLMAQMNLADSLANLRRGDEAEAIVMSHRSHLERYGDSIVQLRAVWTEAHVARAKHNLEDARSLLNEVRAGWLALNRPYEAAIATLEAAELHLARGDWSKVRRQAERLAPVFAARGVHREARAALILFQQAAAAERLTAGLLTRLRRYLALARNDRTYRFDPAGG